MTAHLPTEIDSVGLIKYLQIFSKLKRKVTNACSVYRNMQFNGHNWIGFANNLLKADLYQKSFTNSHKGSWAMWRQWAGCPDALVSVTKWHWRIQKYWKIKKYFGADYSCYLVLPPEYNEPLGNLHVDFVYWTTVCVGQVLNTKWYIWLLR